jgi:hypothetical protein
MLATTFHPVMVISAVRSSRSSGPRVENYIFGSLRPSLIWITGDTALFGNFYVIEAEPDIYCPVVVRYVLALRTRQGCFDVTHQKLA